MPIQSYYNLNFGEEPVVLLNGIGPWLTSLGGSKIRFNEKLQLDLETGVCLISFS